MKDEKQDEKQDEKPPVSGSVSGFVTRFAPSPNGWLHLGHAYAALMAAKAAQAADGQFLLRIEDIDVGRARPHFVEGIFQDLAWLGLSWPEPVMVQSARFDIYQAALADLRARDLVYPCWATRREILAAIEDKKDDKKDWQRDPDGAPLYPGLYRDLPDSARKKLMWEGAPYCWRLDMAKALAQMNTPLSYCERGGGTAEILPLDAASYGDVILARKDVPTSYHLSVVIDDAAQGVTQVTRGQDLQAATAIHVLLQKLLGLPQPDYLHHSLVRDISGRRLSKQAGDLGFRDLRQQGMDLEAVLALLPPPFGAAD
jgi:glutamyl-Q tRNA(Asp) synthetase